MSDLWAGAVVKLLVLNDIHIADKPPQGRTRDYTSQIFTKLEECRELAASCDATAITGDLFHTKRAPHVSHGLVQRTIDLFRGWPHTPLAIVGNHDLSEEGIASIPRQPIGVLFKAGVLNWLNEDIIERYEDGVSILWSPANYTDDIDDDPDNFSIGDDVVALYSGLYDWSIKVAHGMLTPPGKWFPFQHVPMDTVPTRNLDLVVFGHPHYDMGVKEVNDCMFAGLGSLSRVARTPENRKRKVRVLEVELTKEEMSFQPHVLKSALPSSEVFIDEVTVAEEATGDMAEFASALAEAVQLEDGDPREILAKLGADIPENVQRKMMLLLEEAGL